MSRSSRRHRSQVRFLPAAASARDRAPAGDPVSHRGVARRLSRSRARLSTTGARQTRRLTVGTPQCLAPSTVTSRRSAAVVRDRRRSRSPSPYQRFLTTGDRAAHAGTAPRRRRRGPASLTSGRRPAPATSSPPDIAPPEGDAVRPLSRPARSPAAARARHRPGPRTRRGRSRPTTAATRGPTATRGSGS
jgi:hypothetical protein